VHNVAIIFYIFDFIKVFRQTDVSALGLRGSNSWSASCQPTKKLASEKERYTLPDYCHEA